LVETKTLDTSDNIHLNVSLVRYQHDNHLGSAYLELDEAGNVISYEEYYPYGSTSYQAGRSAAEVGLKRYRYTGKEHDNEIGLYYHGARYYVSWLGRWISCDPSGLEDGVNLYTYVQNRPTIANDPNGKWLNIVVGALIGAAVGAGVELARQAISGEDINWGRVGASAAGGLVGGAIAGATMGTSLLGSALLAEGVGVASGAVVGGTVTRTINGEPTTPRAAATDAGIALLTFGLLRGGGAVLSRVRGSGGGSGSAASGARGASRGSGSGRSGASRGSSPRDFRARAQAGEIPPVPQRPPIPSQFRSLAEFGGENGINWGSQLSPAQSRALAREFTRERLNQLGITREMLEQWRSFYRYFERYDPGNPSAPGRAAYLDELLNRFFPSPRGAAVPAAGAAVASGLQPPREDSATTSRTSSGAGVEVTSPLLDSLGGSWLSPNLGQASSPSQSSSPLQLRRQIDIPPGRSGSAYNPGTNTTTIIQLSF
jgi:RHS repeat-associated protein